MCHASVAHFTRTGNSDTPENTASLPSASAVTVRVSGHQLVKLLEDLSRFLLLLPFTLCVIIDADAFEMAQPEP